jgi:drug/metabolite transporter (DMT)-like permease
MVASVSAVTHKAGIRVSGHHQNQVDLHNVPCSSHDDNDDDNNNNDNDEESSVDEGGHRRRPIPLNTTTKAGSSRPCIVGVDSCNDGGCTDEESGTTVDVVDGKSDRNNSSSSNNNNNNSGSHDNPKRYNIGRVIWKYVVLHILQIANIFLWYWTNGMNGIAMQTFATQVSQRLLSRTSTPSSSTVQESLSILYTCCFITSRQLVLGAAIGRVLLLGLNSTLTWSKIQSTHWWPMSVLHGVGSLATNIGFMYGKASVIQVLKLLEPFETLLLSQLLFRESTFSTGVISSMALVVGAAVSLLTLQPTSPSPQAISAAVVSGATLSCRNVLQRKHHRLGPTSSSRTATTPTATTTTTTHNQRSNVHTQSSSSSSASSSASSSTSTSSSKWDRLEKSIVQFTQLSFYSGLYVGVVSLLLRGILVKPDEYGYGTSYSSFNYNYNNHNTNTPSPSLQLFLWHPLYNIFSMITLGFCSAITHSLLNSGKRVFAICLAILWFHEGLNPATIAGLFLVGVGGFWYLAEGTSKPSSSSSIGDSNSTSCAGMKDRSDSEKVVIATSALGLLYWFQSLYRS